MFKLRDLSLSVKVKLFLNSIRNGAQNCENAVDALRKDQSQLNAQATFNRMSNYYSGVRFW